MRADTPGRPGPTTLWPALVALLVLCLLVPSAAGSGSAKPVISDLDASPAAVASGGQATVTASVSGALQCTLSTGPHTPVSGLPVTFSCESGSVERVVTMPANTKKKAAHFRLTLTAAAGKRHTRAITKVSVSPGGQGNGRPEGQWAYNESSIFNMPIAAHPELSPDSKTEIAFISTGCSPLIKCLGIEGYGIPTYWASASTPMVKVEVTVPPMTKCGEEVVELPIPAAAKEEQAGKTIPGRDAPFVVFGSNGVEYDAFRMTEPGVAPDGYAEELGCPATKHWQAEGTSPPNFGTTYWKSVSGHAATSGEFGGYHADRNPYGSGLLTEKDFELPANDPWPHAIAMTAAFTCEGDGHGTAEQTWCKPPRPAHLTTGGCPYLQGGTSQPFTWNDHSAEEVCLPEGARLQLEPESEGGPNCETTTLLSEGWQRQYCKTLQIYGIIIDDTGGNPVSPQMTAIPQAPSSYHSGFLPPFGKDCKAEAENPANHHTEKLCEGSGNTWAAAMPRAIMEKMRVLKF